ncbi:hypothetical protein [Lacinutrix sp. MedPE-SW]|uniref:hypothetical protein n=1 Tax=Lacinutrix sp. MedPE-SW TaxID=1860087 RepID=UPI0009203E04|nr:hypothetical protein [Lacinutrix sp. MedPE-SW]OIQ24019.1 MAG: hypothetical protein BM549_01540 [Lacinutrix sp. MedPE-SW]
MESFIQNNFTNITKGIEIIAAVTGIFCLKKYKGTAVIYFIYFLIYAVFVENFGNYTKLIGNYDYLDSLSNSIKDTVFIKNYWWYQIFWIIGSPLFFSFYFYKTSKNIVIKKSIKIIAFFFLLTSFLLLIFKWNALNYGFIKIIDLLSLAVVLFLVFSYFFELLRSNQILYFYKLINLYISIGILLFWLIVTPMTFYEVYFYDADWNFIILKWQIFLFAILFMYTIFTIGLIVSKPEKAIKPNEKLKY